MILVAAAVWITIWPTRHFRHPIFKVLIKMKNTESYDPIWKYSGIKSFIGYSRWEAIKARNNQQKKEQLLANYNEGKRVLFIHIPKTAGRSLIDTYQDIFIDAHHSPFLSYKNLLGKNISNVDIFSIVRNPWARIFSAYNYLIRGGLGLTDPGMGSIIKNDCENFEQFIKEWLPKNGTHSYTHFLPQHEFLCDWRGILAVSNIIKLEELDSLWPGMTTKLGIENRPLPKNNTSESLNYQDFYDNQSIMIVEKLYKKDIALFGYKFN
jgi:hypothetical protein